MIIYINLCKTKGVLGSWKLKFSHINENLKKIKISARFRPIFDFEGKKVTSRAELKILQLELWLEPARLRLITGNYPVEYSIEISDLYLGK